MLGAGPHAGPPRARQEAPPAATGPAAERSEAPRPVPAALTAGPRPAIPASLAEIWLVPARPVGTDKAATDFANAVRLLQDAHYAEALPLLTSANLAGTPLAPYSAYFTGIAYLNLSRASEARTVFANLRGQKPGGFLSEGAPLREAEAAVAQGDNAAAAKIYEEMAQRKIVAPDAVLLALGRAQLASGNRERAADTFARLYYQHPLSELAAMAKTELEGLKDLVDARDANARFKMELARAERLFTARRYQPARQAFEGLKGLASGDDAEIVALRIAESDHYLGKYGQATDGLHPYLQNASRKAEARFFYLTATRELGDHEQYVQLARALVSEFPESSWAEETLNNLATHYILVDDDAQADATFRELYQRFPSGRHAQRAAWKAGWYSYKLGRYEEASALFEGAATTFPRSDYRPAYLFWAARSREAANDRAGAQAVLKIVATDYLHSYYGRLAEKRLAAEAAAVKPTRGRGTSRATGTGGAKPAAARAAADATGAADAPAQAAAGTAAASAPIGADLIRLLISLKLYEAARDELLWAQRNGADSPSVTATLAWVYNKLGDYRRGIILMRRAYPTYMSAASTPLPDDLLRVIFPMDYWPLIRRYAPQRNLDPYLVAALINQESSFIADARSSANAIGLMQLLPSTARKLARQLRVRRYSVGSLTKPEVNIQLGTAYFSDLVRRLGGVHFALASYNAGPHRVATWTAERPGLDRDEFIDDIPFPETQGYVKRIIGTAEDYRRLYGNDGRLDADADGNGTATAAGAPVGSRKRATTKAPAKPAKGTARPTRPSGRRAAPRS